MTTVAAVGIGLINGVVWTILARLWLEARRRRLRYSKCACVLYRVPCDAHAALPIPSDYSSERERDKRERQILAELGL